ncbi:MAG: esterase-like activity of phytase family protein [Chloroflexi bacterium]|nr:esterase-like activity of phytase family protein [Chloroflexota bacterium]
MRTRETNVPLRLAILAGLPLLLMVSLMVWLILPTEAAPGSPVSQPDTLELKVLGTYDSGIVDASAAEIVTHDPATQRLFVVNANTPSVDVIDISEPLTPTLVFTISVATWGAVVNSVDFHDGVLATAVEADPPQNPGTLVFFDADGMYLNDLPVGAMPDMVKFTPDGRYILTANEGEPDLDYLVDPEGSISVINMSGGVLSATVATADFQAFIGREEELRQRGVRIFGPNANAAQDIEPEYIAVSPDSSTAFVTLQENNAFAVVDIAAATMEDILPLGLKDYSQAFATLDQYPFTDLPVLGTTPAGQTIHLGGFSGLWFEGVDGVTGNYQFVTLPDRGPNGAPTGGKRPFVLPDYQARVVRFELAPASGDITITQQITLTRPDGVTPITGLPNIAGVDEAPIDLNLNDLPYDEFGADMEGIVVTDNGHFWMVDEYRPAIYHFDASGVLVARFVPRGTAAAAGQPEGTFGSETLPAEYALRRDNRGFEAMALDTDSGILYAFIQTPLMNPDLATSNSSDVIRILGIDPTDGRPVAEYVYLLEGVDYRDAKVDKIGDAVYAGDGRFYVIERDSSTEPYAKKYIFEVDLKGATNVLPITTSGVANGRTTTDPYLFDLSGGYGILPLLTNGDEVPLLAGAFPNFTPSATETYAMPGTPDGLGLYQAGNLNYVFVNHEFGNTAVSALSLTTPGQINGSRVSLFVFDQDWRVVGGKNLIETVSADGATYTLDPTTGNYEDGSGNVLNNGLNFSRFCSGYLAQGGFVDGSSAPIPVWFAPEEDGSAEARGWAAFADGTAVPIDGLGRYAKEQVLPASQYRADNADVTVLFSTEDDADGELYMYAGTQTVSDPNGFAAGSLYVLRVEDDLGNIFDYETMTSTQTLTGTWTAVPEAIALGTALELSDWVNANQRSTNFRRPEDIHEDPNNPGTFYFVTTGRSAIPPGGTEPDNALGKLYHFTLDAADPTAPMPIEFLLEGSETTGVSYDNMVVDSSGLVLLQEDRATTEAATILANQMRYGRILAYDPVSDTVDFLFEANQGVIDPSSATDYGNWESSGIIEVGVDGGSGQSLYLLDVQAHTLPDPYTVEGGQLLLALPGSALPPNTPIISGTLEQQTADSLVAAGIQPVHKIKVTNLPSIGYLAGDKAEGLAMLADGRLAVLNDNDFGLLDQPIPGDGTVALNPNPTPAVLGIISFPTGNMLDASDRDGGINLQNWPVYGIFMPDSTAAFSVNGLTYYLTANEGDSRDYPGFSEELRVKDLTLDTAVFPNAASLQLDENMGRLKTTIAPNGDLDSDGANEYVYSFGARSFSVWDQFGNLVADSGDEFAHLTIDLVPGIFNSNGAADTFDMRSDDKGMEPEALTVGELYGRVYAFIGFERTGGIVVYDVTNPAAPHYVSYQREPEMDIAPEGLKFIAAADSPTGRPLLAVANEVSGTTTLYEIDLTFNKYLPMILH